MCGIPTYGFFTCWGVSLSWKNNEKHKNSNPKNPQTKTPTQAKSQNKPNPVKDVPGNYMEKVKRWNMSLNASLRSSRPACSSPTSFSNSLLPRQGLPPAAMKVWRQAAAKHAIIIRSNSSNSLSEVLASSFARVAPNWSVPYELFPKAVGRRTYHQMST